MPNNRLDIAVKQQLHTALGGIHSSHNTIL
jgi:hypothetical protein